MRHTVGRPNHVAAAAAAAASWGEGGGSRSGCFAMGLHEGGCWCSMWEEMRSIGQQDPSPGASDIGRRSWLVPASMAPCPAGGVPVCSAHATMRLATVLGARKFESAIAGIWPVSCSSSVPSGWCCWQCKAAAWPSPAGAAAAWERCGASGAAERSFLKLFTTTLLHQQPGKRRCL